MFLHKNPISDRWLLGFKNWEAENVLESVPAGCTVANSYLSLLFSENKTNKRLIYRKESEYRGKRIVERKGYKGTVLNMFNNIYHCKKLLSILSCYTVDTYCKLYLSFLALRKQNKPKLIY